MAQFVGKDFEGLDPALLTATLRSNGLVVVCDGQAHTVTRLNEKEPVPRRRAGNEPFMG